MEQRLRLGAESTARPAGVIIAGDLHKMQQDIVQSLAGWYGLTSPVILQVAIGGPFQAGRSSGLLVLGDVIAPLLQLEFVFYCSESQLDPSATVPYLRISFLTSSTRLFRGSPETRL